MPTALVLPAAFPDLHWLGRIISADRILIDDTTTFSRKSTTHRGRIRTPDGLAWIYLPLHPEDRSIPLRQARTDTTSDWVTPLQRSLEFNYRNSIWFDHYEHELHEILQVCASTEGYLDAVQQLNRVMFRWLELPDFTQKWSFRSMISDEEWLAICEESEVWLEYRSKNYQAPVPGGVVQIPLDARLSDDHTLRYRQHFGGFESGCCWLDLLFACGPDCWQILDNIKR